MAIEVKRFGTTPQTLTPATISGAGSTSTSNKPIDLKIDEQSSKGKIDTAITSYINSEEFKNLSPEEQIKLVKEKFFPAASDEQVKNYIATARQQITTNQTSETTTQNGVTPAEVSTLPTSTPSAESPEISSSGKSDKQSDIERFTNAYIEKNGFKGTIDDLKVELLGKQKLGHLTEEEQKLLNSLQEAASPAEANAGKTKKFETLIPMSTLISEEFRKKPQIEQLSDITDAYLTKNDEKYAGLSDEEKTQYKHQQIENIIKALNTEGKSLSEKEKKTQMFNAMILLQNADTEGKPIEEYINKSPEELKQTVADAKKTMTQKLINSIPEKELAGKSPQEKVMAYASVILSMGDEGYNSLSGEAKEQYLKDKSNEFIEKNLGIKGWTAFSKNNPKAANNLAQYASAILCKLVEEGKSFDDFQELSKKEQDEVVMNYLKNNPSPETEALERELETKFSILEELQSGGIENPTEKDVYNYLKRQASTGNISDNERQLLKQYEAEKDLGVDHSKRARTRSNTATAHLLDTDTQTYINVIMKDVNVKDKNELNEVVGELVAGSRSIDELNLIYDILKEKGLSEEEIAQLIPQDTVAKYSARALAENNGDELTHIRVGTRRMGKLVAATAEYAMRKAAEISARYFDNIELTKFGEQAVQDELVSASFTQGLNNREYISRENAAEVSGNILRSDNVANAYKASFTQDMIRESKKNGPEEQLYFAEQYSKIENTAVTEALAASTKYVDESVQNQYNSYVDNAVKNYPPEQQAQIQTVVETARQTGTISQETLSQTTPPVVSNTQQSSKSAATQKTNSTVSSNNSSKVQNQTTSNSAASASKRTAATASPAVGKSNGAQNVKTQVTQSANSEQTSKELQAKKEMLVERLVQFEEKKTEKEQERIQEKIQTSENKDSAANVSSTSTAVSSKTADTPAEQLEQLTLTKGEEQALKEVFNSGGITALYEALIQKTGNNSCDIFFEKLVQLGKPSDVLSFANNYKDSPDVILNLINYCPNKDMRFDLLKLLPSNSIKELVSTQGISSVDFEKLVRNGKVESNTIIEFLNKNKGSMTIEEMKKYSSFLSLDDRNLLNRLITQKMGVTPGSDEWMRQQRESMRTSPSSSPQEIVDNFPTFDDAIELGSTRVPFSRGNDGYDKMKKTGHTYIG